MQQGIRQQKSPTKVVPTVKKHTVPSLTISQAIRAFGDSQDSEGLTKATQESYYKVLVVLARYLI